MNKAIFIGRLTKDPDLRETSTGIAVCRFTLAVNRPYNKEETDFFNIIAWRKQAENCSKYLSKGSQCAVEGTVQNRTYDKDGIKHYITEIMADRVEFLGGNKKDEQESFSDLPEDDSTDFLPF